MAVVPVYGYDSNVILIPKHDCVSVTVVSIGHGGDHSITRSVYPDACIYEGQTVRPGIIFNDFRFLDFLIVWARWLSGDMILTLFLLPYMIVGLSLWFPLRIVGNCLVRPVYQDAWVYEGQTVSPDIIPHRLFFCCISSLCGRGVCLAMWF